MSTYYRPSEPIAIKEIEKRCKDDFKVLYKFDGREGQYFRDNEGNILHFALNEKKEVIDIFRYGGNNPEFILDTLESCFCIYTISEYDEEYEDHAHEETSVVKINIEMGESNVH